ncbi:MAG: ABC transporter ATP-binding protein [Pseudomonadota bacterium]
MAQIDLKDLRHSYTPDPASEADYALKRMDVCWRDGGAYALLGPSGCGKSTLLNIISGLVAPSEGRILFDGQDVTHLPPNQRHIAQVFQFPVIYDTMTVYDNLAFPLRNRRVPAERVDQRVREIAEMLELGDRLSSRAAGLGPDDKQKISMGRGVVRDDVNVIMFDEPLTVIDPHLKWKLRSKLKELHQRVKLTMIYVTHDQTEALTFADEVIVMQDGRIVQIGTPVDLFERPTHTFVGHFIGSPGMNLLPCALAGDAASYRGRTIPLAEAPTKAAAGAKLELGVRPEFVRFVDATDPAAIPVDVVRVADAGRHRIVETRAGEDRIFLLAPEGDAIPDGAAHVAFRRERTRVYADGWLASDQTGA